MTEREGPFRYGDRVLLVTELGNRYVFRLKERQRFHSSEGYFEAEQIVGKSSGSLIESNTNKRAVVFRPSILESLLELPRRTQITYPKEMGLILITTGISPGSKVVEGGTGTGVLALLLANYVRPSGRVYSYDLNDEYFPLILRHAELLGLADYIELKKGDICEGVEEDDVDAFIVDVPEPWRAIDTAKRTLKPGGTFASVVPTVNQLETLCETLRSKGFIEYFAGELLMRLWRVKSGITRPQHHMRAHTVFVVVARKTNAEGLSNWRLKIPDGFR